MMYLFYDTETTGLRNDDAAVAFEQWPRVVQLAWSLYDDQRRLLTAASHIITPVGFTIPDDATAVHGITTERALREGRALEFVLAEFSPLARDATTHVAHNITFDEPVTSAEYQRKGLPTPFSPQQVRVCTMRSTRGLCKIPSPSGRGYKYPKLKELHRFLFGEEFDNQHDANADTNACARCYFELEDRGFWRKE